MRALPLAALTAAVVVATPVAASAMDVISVVNPMNGCTYTVYGPDFTVYSGPPGGPGITKHGGVGESVRCP
jgi:hypothetical protein